MKWLICKFVNFCLVGIRLKQDTLRSLPLDTILEWKLVLERDGQLVKNLNVGIVIVLFMCCRCFLIHKVLKSCELVACIIFVVLSTHNCLPIKLSLVRLDRLYDVLVKLRPKSLIQMKLRRVPEEFLSQILYCHPALLSKLKLKVRVYYTVMSVLGVRQTHVLK